MKIKTKSYFESNKYFCMKIINVREHHACDKNNTGYVSVGVF